MHLDLIIKSIVFNFNQKFILLRNEKYLQGEIFINQYFTFTDISFNFKH